MVVPGDSTRNSHEETRGKGKGVPNSSNSKGLGVISIVGFNEEDVIGTRINYHNACCIGCSGGIEDVVYYGPVFKQSINVYSDNDYEDWRWRHDNILDLGIVGVEQRVVTKHTDISGSVGESRSFSAVAGEVSGIEMCSHKVELQHSGGIVWHIPSKESNRKVNFCVNWFTKNLVKEKKIQEIGGELGTVVSEVEDSGMGAKEGGL